MDSSFRKASELYLSIRNTSEWRSLKQLALEELFPQSALNGTLGSLFEASSKNEDTKLEEDDLDQIVNFLLRVCEDIQRKARREEINKDRGSAEIKLKEAFAALPSVKRDILESSYLRDYWDDSWERAPFEEQLTFLQLLSIGVEALERKRSTTPQKMLHIAQACELIIKENSHRHQKVSSVEQEILAPLRKPFSSNKKATCSFNNLLCEALEYSLPQLGLRYPAFKPLCDELPSQVDGEVLIKCIEVVAFARATPDAASKKLLTQIEGILQGSAHSLKELIDLSLSNNCTSTDKILARLKISDALKSTAFGLIELCLLSLGAYRLPKAKLKSFHLWSPSRKRFISANKLFLEKLPLTEVNFKKLKETIFPELSAEETKAALGLVFDAKKKVWKS